MNSDEAIGKVLEFVGTLGILQAALIVLAAAIFLGLPPIIIRRAKRKAAERGVEVVEDYNSILPFPKEIDTAGKVLVSLCYILGFVILALSLGIN